MFASLRQMLAECGWLATGLFALDRALRAVRVGRVHFYRLEVQPVQAKPLLPPHRGRQFVIRQLQAGEASLHDVPRPATALATRFAKGSTGLGGFLDGKLVGMIWLHFGAYPEDEVRCTFVPGERCAWDFDVYVRPELRTSFLFARLWDAAFELLRARGIERTACRVSAWNVASIHAHRRMGAQRDYSAAFIVVGSWQVLATSRPPYLHLSIRRSQSPTLRVG